MADFLEQQKKQSLFQQEVKEKTLEQGNVSQLKMAEATLQSSYVSTTAKAKDKAFFTEDPQAEYYIAKVKEKALTKADQRDILEEDRKFRAKAGIRL